MNRGFWLLRKPRLIINFNLFLQRALRNQIAFPFGFIGSFAIASARIAPVFLCLKALSHFLDNRLFALLPIKRIMAPVDFSEFSFQALQKAAELAVHFERDIHQIMKPPGLLTREVHGLC